MIDNNKLERFIVDTISRFGEDDGVVKRIYVSSEKYKFCDTKTSIIFDVLSVCLFEDNSIWCHVSNADDTEQFFVSIDEFDFDVINGFVKDFIDLYNSNSHEAEEKPLESKEMADNGIVLDLDRLKMPNYYKIKKKLNGLNLYVGMYYSANYLKENYPYFNFSDNEFFEPMFI